MEGFQYIDIFATKGLEYLIVIGFLFTFVVFWRFLNRSNQLPVKETDAENTGLSLVDWFYLADDFYYHQGHSWTVPETANTARVGMDDFAQKLIGKPSQILLPEVGLKVKQGDKGWQLKFDSKTIDMLSPVNGKVVEVNQDIIKEPHLINDDPYQKGWLFKIKSSELKTDLKNLLSGNMARLWITETVDVISSRLTGEREVVLQDGGDLISGFVREIQPDNWEALASELFLTNETQ